jgi:hypothetical protein
VGLTALTAASLCVVLTLELTLDTATFLAEVLRAAGLVAAFRALTAVFGFALVFFAVFAERRLTALRADGLEEVALLAFGFEAGFALTARFAVFAVGFAFERDADRLKPFVRLLLMWEISKGCSLGASSRKNARELTIEAALNQRAQVFAGALRSENWTNFRHKCQQRKTLAAHCWLC